MAGRQILSYVRVSTDDQTLEQQRDAIVQAYPPGTEIDWYEDVHSGWQGSRQDYELLKKILMRRTNCEVCVFSVSRLGRNQREACRFMDIIQSHGHKLRVLKEDLDFNGPMGYAFFTIFAALSQMDSDTKSAATRAALQRKKQKEDWKCHGSPSHCVSQKVKDKAELIYQLHEAGKTNKYISRQLELDERSVARVLKLKGYPLLTRSEYASMFPGWHKRPATEQPTLEDIRDAWEAVNVTE